MTPLMTELLLWFGARLTGERPTAPAARLATFVGLIDRELITPLRGHPDGERSVHALTTDGLIWLHRNGTTGEMRRNAVRRLWVEADHAAALGDFAELTRIEAYLSGVQSGRPVRGRKPAERTEFAGSHAYRPGDGGRCSFADCGCPPSSPNHAGWEPREWSKEDEARVIAKGAAPCGVHAQEEYGTPYGDRCTYATRHDGNHSWAPDDLAPSSVAEQRAALAADREHTRRTQPTDIVDTVLFDAEQFRGLKPAPGPVPAGSVTLPRHGHYGADARWTHEAGDTFKVNDGATPELTVRARAVRGQRGRFELFFLGRFVALVEWDGGWWSPVKPERSGD